ncbi:retrotransposon protein, putative, ty1-copia subclass [Tanacetum coccineum]
MGYSFYYPLENKVFIARNAEFLEDDLITQEASESLEDLEIIQEEDTHPSKNTSIHHDEGDQEINEPQSDVILIRRSTRTRHAPDRMCLYINDGEYELGDLNEPVNYKAALLDPESDKWLDAMNVEMKSMKDNEVWDLVDLPSNARLVAKGFIQTYRVDYEEIFSPIANIRSIRILIAIAAFYDYEIWQMDVNTAFLNGHLSEEVYMVQPEGEAAYILRIKIYRDRSKRLIGLCQSAYIEKILKRFYMENSKRGSILMQEKLKLSKSQGASTPAEVNRMQNIPYVLAVGSIIGDIKRELKVSCYIDVGYLTDADDLKYQTRYVFILNRGVVDWKSTKQIISATSPAEVEYIAASYASKEAI